MNHVSGILDGQKWTRTSKQAARNAYNKGEEVLICAVNLSPFSVWRPGYVASTVGCGDPLPFERVIREYCWYNCTSNETGRYAAFYVKAKGGK